MNWSVEKYRDLENARLIQLMDKRGLTLQSLAESAGISEKTLWCIAKGKSYPRLDTLLLICHALNCSMDYLYPMDLEI